VSDPKKQHVLIVSSLRPRTGKTLLARLLAEYLTFSGVPRVVFDTDAADPKLSSYFPNDAKVVDLDRVPDQMKLFDTLVSHPGKSQVIDLTHRSFAKFFNLMRDIGFADEAKAAGVEPVVFFILDGTAEAYDQALALRERFRDTGLVLMTNDFVGEPSRGALNSSGMIGLAGHKPQMRLPVLDPFYVSALEDPRLSLSEFMRRATQGDAAPPLPMGQMSLAYLSIEARSGITTWIAPLFNEFGRTLKYTDLQARILAHDRFGA
jgi:hypothetical protein